MKNFSIIIPIFNESESIFELIDEIILVFGKNLPEIIIVDDGSTDNFIKKKDKIENKTLIFSHKNNLGKCKAMYTGIQKANNELICIIDGDGQNPPYEIKKLLECWKNLDLNYKKKFLICGHRINRQDNFKKRISSKIANSIRRFILNDDCNDTACALKLFLKSNYLSINYFRNMHRFLPAVFKAKGCKIFNVLVNDRPRSAGKSKYNFNNRFWIGIIDLIKVWKLITKEKKNGK
tara:strand:+ start:134 stop:838 length:705 start_codon:yes stop_codon:yes gene_type:complete